MPPAPAHPWPGIGVGRVMLFAFGEIPESVGPSREATGEPPTDPTA